MSHDCCAKGKSFGGDDAANSNGCEHDNLLDDIAELKFGFHLQEV